jgi:arabinan endo-1,5-alpha-L-arabinosidase
MDYGRVARIAAPVAAAAVATAVVAPLVGDALTNDVRTTPPEPTSTPPAMPSPMVPPAPGPAADAREGALDARPAPAPEPARRTYMNPVFAENAPDPTVVRGDDGMFYAYTTESARLPFQVLRSPDLVSWERVGGAFAGDGPSWVKEHRWAPDVKKTGDHFTMLYSGRGHDGQMRIGYATSKDPAGPFSDRGVLIDSFGSIGFVIDPYLASTPQGWKVLFGSSGGTGPADQTGIKSVDVTIASDGSMKTTSAAKVVLSETGERELVEGAWLHERDGTWYLFYSDGKWDSRGDADDYAVKVARSSSPDGPFEKFGAPILQQGAGYTGTGHNAIVTDDAGRDWILYHGWGSDESNGRVLLLDPIEYHDGWPVINNGAGPSTRALDAPVIAARQGAGELRP